MANITKVGAVTFTHNEALTGEVEIERGGVAVKVPMESLQKLVAEKLRLQMIETLQQLKPSEILALVASRK